MLKILKKLFFDANFQRKKSFLRSLSLFKDLRDRELALLAQALHVRTYHPGEVVFMEGDIGRALFILETGKVELTRVGHEGKQEPVYTVQPEEFFGEMALLEQLPRTATATAAERSHLYLLYRPKLDSLMSRQPRIGAFIMGHLATLLSARLRRVSARPLTAAPRA